MKLLLATSNPHKNTMLKDLLQQIPTLDIYTLHNFPSYSLPNDDHRAPSEKQAEKRATHAAKTLDLWALADISGLVVPVLNPPESVAFFTGSRDTEADRRQELLDAMQPYDLSLIHI